MVFSSYTKLKTGKRNFIQTALKDENKKINKSSNNEKTCAALILPWKNNQPCGIPAHHIHTRYRTEIGQHHNKESCDQETILPNNIDSAHRPCSFCHQPAP